MKKYIVAIDEDHEDYDEFEEFFNKLESITSDPYVWEHAIIDETERKGDLVDELDEEYDEDELADEYKWLYRLENGKWKPIFIDWPVLSIDEWKAMKTNSSPEIY